jgi:hypothetical protein
MAVARSASGEGASPSASSRARTKRSIGLRTHAASFTAGKAGRDGARKAQCRPQRADAEPSASSGQRAP